jgi:ribosomal protein S18 acetylase RimI-like enzyme
VNVQTGSAQIRPYRESDLRSLYTICVRVADAGGDARGKWITDDLMGDLFAAPYAVLRPQLAFVVEDEGEVVGYVVGADTAQFLVDYRREWIPRLLDRYPVPIAAPTTPDEEMIALHHDREVMLLPELEGHPAHLHISLLPSAQGKGYGRALMAAVLPALAAEGMPAVHVGMLTSNTAARGFYDRLGWQIIEVPDPGPLTYLGRPTRGAP